MGRELLTPLGTRLRDEEAANVDMVEVAPFPGLALSNEKIHKKGRSPERVFHIVGFTRKMNTFGGRLFEERHRLQLSQAELAIAIGVSERSIGNYERGRRSPDAEQLLRLAAQGLDVYHVLTGKRVSGRLDLNPMQRAVLDDFDRCSHVKQIEAVRCMALLAEGAPLGVPAKQVRKSRTREAEAKRSQRS